LQCIYVSKIISVNTHFASNPKIDYVKYFQMYLVLNLINKQVKDKENEPVIVCGDLNSFPHSNVIRLILNQEEPKQEFCDIQFSAEAFRYYTEIFDEYLGLDSKLKWDTVYKNYKKIANLEGNQGFPDFTHLTGTFKGTLDYIFYTQSSLKPVSMLKIPTREEIKSKSLPDETYPSDHLPLMSYFEYLD